MSLALQLLEERDRDYRNWLDRKRDKYDAIE